MPELPEIRAQADRIGERFHDAELSRFTALSFTALKTVDPSPDAAVGQRLQATGSRGKHLLMTFEACTFVIHLMQGGRLEPDERQAAKPRGGLARWRFGDGTALLLSEAGHERRAGLWVVSGDPHSQPPLAELGPEADEVGVDELSRRLATTSMRLHGFLRDQHQLAGLGRRLANEVCHLSHLSPFANTSRLDEVEVARLCGAIADAVRESLSYESTQDRMTPSAKRPARVHNRTGAPCPECGDVIREVAYQSYTVNYCATCQTDGKVLADNTTSKFLK